jgi:hypothetical protein
VIDPRARLIRIQLLIDRVLRHRGLEDADLWTPGERQLHRLVHANLRHRAVGRIGRRERPAPQRIGPARQHQAFQPVLGNRERLLRRGNGLLESCDLRLRFDHIDCREASLFHLPLVALHLGACLTERRALVVEVAAGEHEIPIRLLHERQLIHQDLLELTIGQIGRASRDQNLVPLDIHGTSLQERLRVDRAEGGWKLWVQAEVGVAAQ